MNRSVRLACPPTSACRDFQSDVNGLRLVCCPCATRVRSWRGARLTPWPRYSDYIVGILALKLGRQIAQRIPVTCPVLLKQARVQHLSP